MKTIKDILEKFGFEEGDAIKFEALLIKHLSKKKGVSQEEAAEFVVKHWAKHLRDHIERAIEEEKKKEGDEK